jgi:hypothetical protein
MMSNGECFVVGVAATVRCETQTKIYVAIESDARRRRSIAAGRGVHRSSFVVNSISLIVVDVIRHVSLAITNHILLCSRRKKKYTIVLGLFR